MTYIREFNYWCKTFGRWATANPICLVLLFGVTGVIVYFFGFLQLFANASQSIWRWAWLRFLPQYNQEHSKLIPFFILFLAWYHRKEIADARKKGSNLGLLVIAAGLVCYIVGARALQPRVSLFGFPFLFFGIILYLWGDKVARIALFPSALLFFMIPLGAIEQTTFKLQLLVIYVVTHLSHLFNIPIYAVGTSLQSTSNDWGFDIAEGCSGIRSLIAMIMITAVYAHLCRGTMWKKVVLLCFSVVFALIGNAGRIFTIIVLARLGFPKFAGGVYHDWSDWVFFPIALLSMLVFSRLLNLVPARAGQKMEQARVVAHE